MLTLLPKNRTFLLRHHCSTATTPPPEEDDAVAANLVLRSDSRSLNQKLRDSAIRWTPELVDKVLKRLWHHGPKALEFFNLLDRNPTYAHASSSFDHAIDIAGRLRDFEAVWALVARMRARRIAPTPKTFAIISDRYVAAGKPEKAFKVFLSMHVHGGCQDLNSFNTVLDVLCKSKCVEKADKFFRDFRGKFGADCVSYNIIANGWCLVKRTPKALEVLKEMVERGLSPNLTTYNIMLNGYFRAGQNKEAWRFFMEMKRRRCEIDVVTYTTLVYGFGMAGQITKARKVFDEMPGNGVLPTVATYNAMIQVLCRKDSVRNAVLVFEEMVRKGYVPDSMSYVMVIKGLCHAGKMEKALEFMGRMQDDECRPNVQIYNVLIRGFMKRGETGKGLELFEKMTGGTCLPNLDTYNILISGMFLRKKPGDLVVAGRLMIEMFDRGFMPRKITFDRLLNGLLLTGNQEFAREILSLQSRFRCLPGQFRMS